MLKKYVVGRTEHDKYFVRRIDTKTISEELAYPIKPTTKEKCIKELSELTKKQSSILILHDGLCGTSDTQQDCIKIIIEAINPNENTNKYGDAELLEFHDASNEFQFITDRHALSKSMIENNDTRTVDVLLDDYFSDFNEAYYVYDILPKSNVYMYRQLVN